MIKSRLKKIILSVVLMTTSVMAGSEFSSESLVGIEGSYSTMNSELSYTSNPAAYSQDTTGMVNLGLKIGAQSEHYRVFLSARYYADLNNDYEYVSTYGAEFQYLFKVSRRMDVFLGVSGGLINAKFAIPVESFSRTISDPYFGGDIGTNFNMNKNIDFELGLRIINSDSNNLKNNINYRLNKIVSGYASLIFKWSID